MLRNLEHDLLDSKLIEAKCRASTIYSQNLYAALCNNEWVPEDIWRILSDQYWLCSWRYAARIVATLRGEGDYIDWYCSGITGDSAPGSISEGTVTDEIKQDLQSIGWYRINASEHSGS